MSLIQYDRHSKRGALSQYDWSSLAVEKPSYGVGQDSMVIGKFLDNLAQSRSANTAISSVFQDMGWATEGAGTLRLLSNVDTPSRIFQLQQREDTLKQKLYDALAAFKVHTAQIAMHLGLGSRARLFRQLDSLLGLEDWVPEDEPPGLASFSTFLRMMLAMKPVCQPGLGATDDGHLVAMWTVESDRLTIECLPNDRIRWVLSRIHEGQSEGAAGHTDLRRLADVLAPYDPKRWFGNGDGIRSA